MANGDLVKGVVDRRTFLGRAAAMAAALGGSSLGTGLLAGCGSDEPSASGDGGSSGRPSGGTLRVAHYEWIGNVAPWLGDLKTAFEEANPGVTVEYLPQASDITNPDELVRKLTLEARQDEATYDLLLGPTPWIEVGALAKGSAILPLDDLLPDSHQERVADAAREESIAPDGKTYSMPFWSDVVGFITRPDLLSEHGVDAPTSWTGLVSTVEELADKLPRGTYAYGADWSFVHRLFFPILVTLTDTPIADNGAIDLSSPAALQALELIKQLHPSMPPNSDQNSGSAEVFQAGNLVMETYWQAQYQRALDGGLTDDQLSFGHNLEGERASTLLWDVTGVVPVKSGMADLAVKFVTEGLLGELGLQKSADVSGRACPVKDLKDTVELPPWLDAAYTQLETGTSLPCNDAFLSVEQPTFLEEIGRMLLEDASPADTQKALADAFSAYEY